MVSAVYICVVGVAVGRGKEVPWPVAIFHTDNENLFVYRTYTKDIKSTKFNLLVELVIV